MLNDVIGGLGAGPGRRRQNPVLGHEVLGPASQFSELTDELGCRERRQAFLDELTYDQVDGREALIEDSSHPPDACRPQGWKPPCEFLGVLLRQPYRPQLLTSSSTPLSLGQPATAGQLWEPTRDLGSQAHIRCAGRDRLVGIH